MEEDIKRAIEVLRGGGVILYPTDTVWGIGCDASNAAAVRRVYEIKQRADSKSMIVLIDSTAKLGYYVDELPDIALDLIDVSDKPLTIIYSGARNVAPSLIAADGTLGIRVTQEAFSQQLCRRLRSPLVSTSANISGQPTPANFSEISETIKKSVDFIVRHRQSDMQKAHPSSIIQLGGGGLIKIIR
ncbi:threonylcarbamoyl-AMP synthase [Bacteroidia bacterium]|nr:threonylcarbamoyl-AMP synthase [Bacteroidia bacterium]